MSTRGIRDRTPMTLDSTPRFDRSLDVRCGEHAVVLGGSMAGLCAARVLADAFDRVTVIERDRLPEGPAARRGVPQANHLHALLEAGRSSLEDLFSGFGEELFSAGGLLIDATQNIRFYAQGGFLAGGERRNSAYSATRPLLECVVRRLLTEVEDVEIRSNCRFTEYRYDEQEGRVTGVQIDAPDGADGSLDAELVVDATGRTSRTPKWLEEQGYPTPEVDEVEINVSYSTILLDRPENDRRGFLVYPSPDRRRTGAVFPVEDGQWLMTLVGIHDEVPPTDRKGFETYADELPIPQFGELLASHPMTSEKIAHYPFPANLRRRYEGLRRFPRNLVVIGDAIASFNPIYAQGMSVAALEAVQLHHTLASGDLERVGPRFFDRITHTVDAAWNLAVGSDHQFPQTVGPKPSGTDIVNRYVARLQRKAQNDSKLFDVFMQVQGMEIPPSALMQPRVLWRVLKP
jgi:2-polyprenyl-6-methoxyphenol hydroxylase-like FAD-dependent oxidoreductase